jgi:hypothetical protein
MTSSGRTAFDRAGISATDGEPKIRDELRQRDMHFEGRVPCKQGNKGSNGTQSCAASIFPTWESPLRLYLFVVFGRLLYRCRCTRKYTHARSKPPQPQPSGPHLCPQSRQTHLLPTTLRLLTLAHPLNLLAYSHFWGMPLRSTKSRWGQAS